MTDHDAQYPPGLAPLPGVLWEHAISPSTLPGLSEQCAMHTARQNDGDQYPPDDVGALEEHVRGSIQVGPARLVIERADAEGIHYRVESPIRHYWGLAPLPGALWEHTRGVSPGTLPELREQCVCWLVSSGTGYYYGPRKDYPYRSAMSDAQVLWCARRGVEVVGAGASIELRYQGRSAWLYADAPYAHREAVVELLVWPL